MGTFYARNESGEYCVKLVKITDKKKKEKTKIEVSALLRLKGNENIIAIKDTFKIKDQQELYYGFVCELMPINLRQFLEMKKNKVSKKLLKDIFHKIGKGLSFIHSKFVVHNDLKLENVMVDPVSYNVKIIDFGLSHVCSTLSEAHTITSVRGTPFYFR